MIRFFCTIILLNFFGHLQAQDFINKSTFHINPELLVGISNDSNENFPDRNLQTQVVLNFGWFHFIEKHSWLQFLKTKKAGLSLGFTSFGNSEELGEAITLQPFFEFGAFKSNDFQLHVATGISYFTEKYDPVSNPNNLAVTTDLTWAFKLFLYYDIIKLDALKWRLGAGYVHNSNGHTSIPNHGYNSFLLSLGLDVNHSNRDNSLTIPKEKSKSNYYEFRMGYGINALTESINDTKSVYTISGEYGKVFNHNFKLGFGAYARFYEMYYDYIDNNESLVQDGRLYEAFKSNPFLNSLNFGISGNAELLYNHIGIDFQIGINFFKPAYDLDWSLNQGWDNLPRDIPNNENIVLGDTNETYFKLKKHISSRLGLKYYILSHDQYRPKNFYVGAFINANLGQADFTEIAFGYVKQFNFNKK